MGPPDAALLLRLIRLLRGGLALRRDLAIELGLIDALTDEWLLCVVRSAHELLRGPTKVLPGSVVTPELAKFHETATLVVRHHTWAKHVRIVVHIVRYEGLTGDPWTEALGVVEVTLMSRLVLMHLIKITHAKPALHEVRIDDTLMVLLKLVVVHRVVHPIAETCLRLWVLTHAAHEKKGSLH